MTDGTAPTAEQAARAWRGALPAALRSRSLWRGLALFAGCFALYWGSFVVAFVAPSLPVRMVAGAIVPLALGALFLVGHDAGHHSLTPFAWLNSALGRISCLPAYHPFTSWTYAHNSLHHAWTCLKGRHPDFPPMSKPEYDALPGWRKGVEHLYRSPIGPGLANIFSFWLPYVAWPTGKLVPAKPLALRLDQALVAAFFVGQLFLGRWLAAMNPNALLPPWPLAFVLVLGTWFAWIFSMGVVSFIQHTHPRIAWYDNEDEWAFHHAQLRGSTHVHLPRAVDVLLSNIMDHPAHHLDTRLPLHALPASQAALENEAPHHSVVVSGSPAEYWRTCKACKLYDYRRHCWTDFAGTPTSPLNLHLA